MYASRAHIARDNVPMHPAVAGFSFVPSRPNARKVSSGRVSIKAVYSMGEFLDFRFSILDFRLNPLWLPLGKGEPEGVVKALAPWVEIIMLFVF